MSDEGLKSLFYYSGKSLRGSKPLNSRSGGGKWHGGGREVRLKWKVGRISGRQCAC